MEFMNLATFVEKGTPVLLLALLLLSVVNTVFITILSLSVRGIKRSIVWRDTYQADRRTVNTQLEDLKRRLKRIEDTANNK